MLIHTDDKDLQNYHLKDRYERNRQQYNQHKSKGYPSFMAWLKRQKLKVGKAQLDIANTLWREAHCTGLVALTADQLSEHLQPASRNWKRDLQALINKGLLGYVHVENPPAGAYQLCQQATLMFNPDVTFSISKWSNQAHRQWLKGCFTEGCFHSCQEYWRIIRNGEHWRVAGIAA